MPLASFGRLAKLILTVSGSCALALAQAPSERSCRVDYQIRARVDGPTKKLTGEELVQWKNESQDDVPDLWFHLYWNAFANNRSTHMQEAGGELRGVAIEDEWGWQQLTSIQVDGQELLPDLRFRQPDDGRVEDKSVFSVPLKSVAKPGATVAVRVKWEAKIPRVRRRTGYKDDFLFIAQWFPKLGVYETGNGWNCHQFHASTEFFSDYGTYDVELDLPAEYEGKIGASGVIVEPSKAGDGRVVTHFVAPSPADQRTPGRATLDLAPHKEGTADDTPLRDATGLLPLVHDFAWTADPKYERFDATFHYEEWAARFPDEIARVQQAFGCEREALRLRDVDVTVLIQPEHLEQARRHFDAACTSLFFYGLWFGEYPYEHITVVDPAWGGGAASGMEYPTLFTAGTRKHTFTEMMSPESVTVHECGHQFWYGLVGNNEFESAWLDEGFNTFTQNEALIRRYGSIHRTVDFASLPFDGVPLAKEPGGGVVGELLALRKWSLPFGITLEPVHASGFIDWWRAQPLLSYARMRDDPRASDRNGYLADPDSDPIDTAGWKYVDRQSYRQNSYRRTAVALRSLEGLVGSDRFLRGMRHYAQMWRYGHPYPQDFFEAFQAGSGIELGWYFEQAFRSTATVDWRVEVTQSQVVDDKGWFANAQGVFEKRSTPHASDDEGSDAAAKDRKQDIPGKDWRVEVIVRRKGTLLLPLKLELTFADGRKEVLVWTRDDQARTTWWKPLLGREICAKKLVSAVLDPEHDYSFDTDLSNNQWFDKTDEIAPLRWAERILTQYAAVLHWYGGLGG